MTRLGWIAGLVGLTACSGAAAFRPGPLAAGTWGGDNAGLIASDTSAHVHIGCTLGDVQLVFGQDPRMGPCPICRRPGG